MRKPIGVVAFVLVVLTTGCLGGIGPLDGSGSSGNDTTDEAYTGGIDGTERQTPREVRVNETRGGNGTLVIRILDEGYAYHSIDWQNETIFTRVDGPQGGRLTESFDESELDEYYTIYAPDWYDTES